MSTILDLLYREYCRARLAEMRKQLLVLGASAEIRQTILDADDLASPVDRGGGWDVGSATKEAPASR